MPTQYVVMLRWVEMQTYASSHSIPWTLGTLLACFHDFSDIYQKSGMEAGALSEGGHGLAWLQKTLGL